MFGLKTEIRQVTVAPLSSNIERVCGVCLTRRTPYEHWIIWQLNCFEYSSMINYALSNSNYAQMFQVELNLLNAL